MLLDSQKIKKFEMNKHNLKDWFKEFKSIKGSNLIELKEYISGKLKLEWYKYMVENGNMDGDQERKFEEFEEICLKKFYWINRRTWSEQ